MCNECVMNVKRRRIIVIMDTSTIGVSVIIFFALCCVFCALECECCTECGRGEPFDAATARNAAEGEVVSNPIEV